jgi:hypothetical protein
VAVFALILGASAGLLEWAERSVTVRVINETFQPLNDVRVSWKGGARRCERLASGEVATWRVKPYGVFDIQLSYLDSEGRESKRSVPLYHDIGYRCYLELHILSEGLKIVDDFCAY